MADSNGNGQPSRDPLAAFQRATADSTETIIGAMFGQLEANKQDYREIICPKCSKRSKVLVDVVDSRGIAQAAREILREYREQMEARTRYVDPTIPLDFNTATAEEVDAYTAAIIGERGSIGVKALALAAFMAEEAGEDIENLPALRDFTDEWLVVAAREG